MFDSGDYGDTWSYVAALHIDRSHPHVHVVVQNRGVENDTWFYMARGHVFNIHHMKERMAAIAAEHGVALETTSRVERGILTYGPSRGEIEAARREGRAVEEKVRMGGGPHRRPGGDERGLGRLQGSRVSRPSDRGARGWRRGWRRGVTGAGREGRAFVPHEVHAGRWVILPEPGRVPRLPPDLAASGERPDCKTARRRGAEGATGLQQDRG